MDLGIAFLVNPYFCEVKAQPKKLLVTNTELLGLLHQIHQKHDIDDSTFHYETIFANASTSEERATQIFG